MEIVSDEQTTPMTLEKQQAVFVSRFKRFRIRPLGCNRKVIVNGEVVRQATPRIQFNDWYFRTRNPFHARLLVENANNFGKRGGYQLDPSCLPEELRKDVWPKLPLEEKRKMALGLIKGESVEDVFDRVDPKLLEEPTIVQAERKVQDVVCPHEGCGARFRGELAHVTLQNHIHHEHDGAMP